MEDRLDTIYLTREQVIETYSKTIEYSGDKAKNELNQALLDSILNAVRDDSCYPTFGDKLTYIVYAINRNHIFPDGNKRLSITVGALFLLLNGYMSCINRYMAEMENVSHHLAAGRIGKELLHSMLCSILNGEPDYEEGLKLRYLEAISDGGIGMDVDISNLHSSDVIPASNKKVVFISYCWEDNEHTAWVKRLAEDLAPYVKIRLDQRLPLGMELNLYGVGCSNIR